MGYALIISGGTDGRYTIEIDIGEAERTALVERFTEQSVQAQAKLDEAQATLAEKQAELDAAALAYEAATAAYIEVLRNEGDVEDGEAYLEIVNGHAKAQGAYIVARTAHAVALANRNALSLSASTITKALAGWEAQILTETRDAWCTDYTEDATGYVATIEIPGESDLILIAPGGRAPVLATDGQLRSRGLMSPAQAYFNAAVLPGWQKFKPTYRWGTITALDEDADTATVSLAEARSSAQRLLVNQENTLAGVPIVYMDCNAEAFEVGDRVVIEFQGQDWAAPRIIGFVDNPGPCIEWPPVRVRLVDSWVETTPASGATVHWVLSTVSTACGIALGLGTETMTMAAVYDYQFEYEDAEFVSSSPGFSITATLPEATVAGQSSMRDVNSTLAPQTSPGYGVGVAHEAGGQLVIYRSSHPYEMTSHVQFSDLETCEIALTFEGYIYSGQAVPGDFSSAGTSTLHYSGPREAYVGLPTVSVTHEEVTKEYVFSHWAEAGSPSLHDAIFVKG